MKKILASATLVIFGLISGSGVAYADQECLKTPEKTITIKHDAVTHKESRWKRDIPEIKEVRNYQFKQWVNPETVPEQRYVRENPGKQEVSHPEWLLSRQNPGKSETTHQEFKYKKTIPATDGVKELEYQKCVDNLKTQYHFAKFTQTRSGKRVSGDVEWGSYGEWTKWSPESYTSWENANDPLGSPALHAAWTEGSGQEKVYYERVWQARWDGQTRHVKDGTQSCAEDWFTSDPGGPWSATGNSRWKVEPKPEEIAYYNDGNWTTDVKSDPWVLIDTRTVGNNDAVAPFTEWATRAGPTADATKASYFTESEISKLGDSWSKHGSPKKVVDSEAVSPFTEWLSNSGPVTNVKDADYFTEAEAAIRDRSWMKYGYPRDRVITEGYWQYKTLTGVAKVQADASWFSEDSFKGWIQFNSEVVVERVPGYTEYFVPNGESTRTLGESNWTTLIPLAVPELPQWRIHDTRIVIDKKAWKEKKVIPAKYGKCSNTLAYTGTDPLLPIGVASGGILVGLMSIGIARRRRSS